jgi:hypothetical protein
VAAIVREEVAEAAVGAEEQRRRDRLGARRERQARLAVAHRRPREHGLHQRGRREQAEIVAERHRLGARHGGAVVVGDAQQSEQAHVHRRGPTHVAMQAGHGQAIHPRVEVEQSRWR